jgi:hypothetical protein
MSEPRSPGEAKPVAVMSTPRCPTRRRRLPADALATAQAHQAAQGHRARRGPRTPRPVRARPAHTSGPSLDLMCIPAAKSRTDICR